MKKIIILIASTMMMASCINSNSKPTDLRDKLYDQEYMTTIKNALEEAIYDRERADMPITMQYLDGDFKSIDIMDVQIKSVIAGNEPNMATFDGYVVANVVTRGLSQRVCYIPLIKTSLNLATTEHNWTTQFSKLYDINF